MYSFLLQIVVICLFEPVVLGESRSGANLISLALPLSVCCFFNFPVSNVKRKNKGSMF